MPAKPGIQKKRVAQRRLHAVVAKPKQGKSNPIAQWLRSLFTRILGRG
jgi:hypothetical protein